MAGVIMKTFPLAAKVPLATVSTPASGIYTLSMHNLPDNRLTPLFIKDSLLPALSFIELDFRRNLLQGKPEATLILTGEMVKSKFFSNGLQLEEVLLTFPMKTISAINGHNFAGGLVLSLCTDFRLIRAERAWCCMNEIDFGAPLPIGMAAVLKERLDNNTVKKVMLSGHRYTATEALACGMVDEIVPGDGPAVIARAIEFAGTQKKFSATGVLGMMKETLYADVLEALKTDEGMGAPVEDNENKLRALEAAWAIGNLEAKL